MEALRGSSSEPMSSMTRSVGEIFTEGERQQFEAGTADVEDPGQSLEQLRADSRFASQQTDQRSLARKKIAIGMFLGGIVGGIAGTLIGWGVAMVLGQIYGAAAGRLFEVAILAGSFLGVTLGASYQGNVNAVMAVWEELRRED